MKSKKKGFTLIEIIVSLSIIVVVLALSSSLIVIISRISQKQQYQEACQVEYSQASGLLDEFKNAYSTYKYTLESVSEHTLIVKDEGNEYTFNFDVNLKKITAQIWNNQTNQIDTRELTFDNIINISFVAQDKNVKCTYEFENFHSYINLLIFGAN